MQNFLSDLRQALRLIRRDAKTSLAVISTLAVVIGLNVSLFAVVRSVLLRALPYRAPHELVLVFNTMAERPGRDLYMSSPDFLDYRLGLQSFSEAAAVRWESATLVEGPLTERLRAARVTPNFFSLLGVTAQLGRAFTAQDGAGGDQSSVLISSRFFQTRYGADPQTVGKSIRLNDRRHIIIGVLPPEFRYSYGVSNPIDIWFPFDDQRFRNASRRSRWLEVIARLRNSVSPQEAQKELDGLAERLSREHAESNAGIGARLYPIHEKRFGHLRFPFAVLACGVAFILLIACCNISALLLSKSAAFRENAAIRWALGAPRHQLFRQALSYAVCLALLGSLAGLLLAASGTGLLQSLVPAGLPRTDQIRMGGAEALFALGAGLAAGLLFGLIPAWRNARPDSRAALGGGLSRSSAGKGESRLLGAIIAAETGLALLLSIAAVLLMQSYRSAAQVDPGFAWENVLTAGLKLPRDAYPDPAQTIPVLDRIRDALESLGPVESFGWNISVPFAGNGALMGYWTDRQAMPPQGEEPTVQYGAIHGAYFQTLGIPLDSGRFFDRRDTAGSETVCIVNRSFAARHWPGEEALGRRLNLRRLREVTSPLVVGVVGDVKQESPVSERVEKIYLPFAQAPQYYGTIVLKTANPPESLVSAVKERLAQAVPNLPVAEFSSLRESVSQLLSERLFFTRLFTVFSLAGVFLVLTGIAGVVRFSVGRRTQEIGIRVALGARPVHILWASLRRTLLFTLAGALAGWASAWGLTRYLSAWLYGLSPTDAATYVGVSLALALTALTSAWLPARQALKLDPHQALHYE